MRFRGPLTLVSAQRARREPNLALDDAERDASRIWHQTTPSATREPNVTSDDAERRQRGFRAWPA